MNSTQDSTSTTSNPPENTGMSFALKAFFHTVHYARFYLSPSERILAFALAVIVLVSSCTLVVQLSRKYSIEVPTKSTSLVEGALGSPRFINPLLAVTDTDQDLTQLVYSGISRLAKDGSIVPDLGTYTDEDPSDSTYTFILNPTARFHDGTPVTAADVAFTVRLAQDPTLKSPRRADWEGVEVETPDQYTVVFKLPKPYAPFLESTTMGILPKHLWENVPSEQLPFNTLNLKPIGTGPFKFSESTEDTSGTVTNLTLTPFNTSLQGKPYLEYISFDFYKTEKELADAYAAGAFDMSADLNLNTGSTTLRKNSKVITAPLPRFYALFFNSANNETLADVAVRRALDTALPKQSIIDQVLKGYGAPLSGPIPAGIVIDATSSAELRASTPVTDESRIEKARKEFSALGFTTNSEGKLAKADRPLTITISTADTDDLRSTAQIIARTWEQLGIQVTIAQFPTSELNTNIIRPRDFQVLLFGGVVGHSLDMYAFWHSTQRTDPGLNFAQYANTTADKLLETGRTETDPKKRAAIYTQLEGVIRNDIPAIFLYSPQFTYIVPVQLKGIELGALTTPSERFSTIATWHTATEFIWPVFALFR
jgi:peptide/nickel transport system substrate-binding protein